MSFGGRDGPARLRFERRHVPYPPEPLRWLALRTSTALLAARDARLDRKLRAGRYTKCARIRGKAARKSEPKRLKQTAERRDP